MRVGIISAAWGTKAHLPAWRAVPGVEVVAVCTAHRATAEAAATTYDIPMPFWDATTMARHPDVDIVDVGTRPDLRRDMCLAALDAGKHVYNGVPFAACWADSVALRDAARASGTVAVVDAYSEFLAPLRFVQELLADGVCGDIQSITGRLDVSLFDRPISTFPYNWFADGRHGASALRNLGTHLLHLFVHLGGPVADVSGVTTRFVDEWRFTDTGGSVRPECDDTAAGVVRFASGVLGQFHVAWAAATAPGFALEIAGNHGRIAVGASGTMPAEVATVAVARRARCPRGGPRAGPAAPRLRHRTGRGVAHRSASGDGAVVHEHGRRDPRGRRTPAELRARPSRARRDRGGAPLVGRADLGQAAGPGLSGGQGRRRAGAARPRESSESPSD